MIYSQRRTGLMQLHQADMKVLMDKAKDAQKTGDTYAYQMAMADVQEFMKEKHLPNMSKMFVPLLANVSDFCALFVHTVTHKFLFRASFLCHISSHCAVWRLLSCGV